MMGRTSMFRAARAKSGHFSRASGHFRPADDVLLEKTSVPGPRTGILLQKPRLPACGRGFRFIFGVSRSVNGVFASKSALPGLRTAFSFRFWRRRARERRFLSIFADCGADNANFLPFSWIAGRKTPSSKHQSHSIYAPLMGHAGTELGFRPAMGFRTRNINLQTKTTYGLERTAQRTR